MIQLMARENGESYKTDAGVLRETITAAIQALGEGKIAPEEMPIPPKTNTGEIRYAPSFSASVVLAQRIPESRYTIDSLAKFLGEAKADGHAHDAFRITFGAFGHTLEHTFEHTFGHTKCCQRGIIHIQTQV